MRLLTISFWACTHVFLGCGATANTQPPPTDPKPATSSIALAPTVPIANQASVLAATSSNVPSPATPNSPATLPAASPPVEERFPSGLVVDQTGVGGPAPGPELPQGTTVLHIGDSFAGALGIELNKVLEQAGVRSLLRFETSTYIPTWAHDKKLPEYLAQYKPDLVLVSLGANELQNPEPEKRIPLIRRIVERLGDRACVWVAPALWDGANPRLLEVIRGNVAPCVYLDTNAFVRHLPRARDKIHPSMEARPDYAKVIARWLAYHRKPTSDAVWSLQASTVKP